jgi:hypothetical protein
MAAGAAVAGAAGLLLATAGCGGDRSGGPKGSPSAIVGNAPQRTLQARTARVEISGQHADASGLVDLSGGLAQLDIRPDRRVVLSGGSSFVAPGPDGPWRQTSVTDAFPASLEAADPFVAIDLVRGVTKIVPWGGAEVRGASAFRYQIQIDPQRAAAAAPAERADILRRIAADAGGGVIHADLFIDSTGRIRRVQLPAELRSGTPPTRNDGEMIAVTIDYTDFGVPASISPPPVGPQP